MPMPIEVTVMVTPGDERVWFDADSLVDYMRKVEAMAKAQYEQARAEKDIPRALGAIAASDALRQVGDGMVLTQMQAVETIRERK